MVQKAAPARPPPGPPRPHGQAPQPGPPASQAGRPSQPARQTARTTNPDSHPRQGGQPQPSAASPGSQQTSASRQPANQRSQPRQPASPTSPASQPNLPICFQPLVSKHVLMQFTFVPPPAPRCQCFVWLIHPKYLNAKWRRHFPGVSAHSARVRVCLVLLKWPPPESIACGNKPVSYHRGNRLVLAVALAMKRDE